MSFDLWPLIVARHFQKLFQRSKIKARRSDLEFLGPFVRVVESQFDRLFVSGDAYRQSPFKSFAGKQRGRRMYPPVSATQFHGHAALTIDLGPQRCQTFHSLREEIVEAFSGTQVACEITLSCTETT